MTPIERLVTWLWDPRGERRRVQIRRMTEGGRKLRKNLMARQRAVHQIRRTQEFVDGALHR